MPGFSIYEINSERRGCECEGFSASGALMNRVRS